MNREGPRWKSWAVIVALGPLLAVEYYAFWPWAEPAAPDASRLASPRRDAGPAQNGPRIVIQGITTIAGSPMPGVRLAFVSGREEFMTQSGAGGLYRLDGVGAPAAMLNVWTNGGGDPFLLRRGMYMPISCDGAETVRIDPALASGDGVIEGAVRVNGKPRPWSVVTAVASLADGSRETVVARADESGRYRLAGIPPGLHELTAQLYTEVPGSGAFPTRQRQQTHVEIRAHGVARCDFDFGLGSVTARLFGIRPFEAARVVMVPGKPIVSPYTAAKVNDILDQAVAAKQVGTGWSISFPSIAPGQYTIYLGAYDADADGFDAAVRTLRVAAAPVRLAAGDDTELDLILP